METAQVGMIYRGRSTVRRASYIDLCILIIDGKKLSWLMSLERLPPLQTLEVTRHHVSREPGVR